MNNLARDRIRFIADNVYQRVAQTLNDEVRRYVFLSLSWKFIRLFFFRIYSLIEEFDRPFSRETNQIPLYKQDLNQWLEERLSLNLQTRLHPTFYASLDGVYHEMKEHVQNILCNSPSRQTTINTIIPRKDFTISYRLDCSNLCSDFQEDIRFKFSLGLTSIWKRFIENQTDIQSSSPVLSSKSGLLTLGICGFVWQYIGWKVIGVVAGFYGSFYLYEKLMWTKQAQERAFKRQYADYAASKMRLIIDLTSGNASDQVKQELSRYFAQIMQHVHFEKDDLIDQISELKQTLKQLQVYHERGQKLHKQAEKIDNEFNQYSKQYLLSDCTN